jgi:hypothetical protein
MRSHQPLTIDFSQHYQDAPIDRDSGVGCDIKRATPKGDDGVFARRAGDTCFGLGKADNTATIWVAHAALPCISKLRASDKTTTPGSLMA